MQDIRPPRARLESSKFENVSEGKPFGSSVALLVLALDARSKDRKSCESLTLNRQTNNLKTWSANQGDINAVLSN